MLLTEQEIDDLSREMVKGCKSVNWLAKKIESAVLEKLKAQEPEITGSERYRVEKTGHGFWPYCVRAGTGSRELFVGHQKQCTKAANALAAAFEDGKFVATTPLPPDDVVRDAERLDWIQANCRCDPMMDGQHKWWPTNFNKCLTGPSIREAIDAAIKEMK